MAGFQDQYPNLPGHMVQFRDGNLNIQNDPNPPATESIVFLGTATDGPVNQPVPVTPDNVNTIFGKMTHPNGVANGATLIPAFEEAWNSGSRDIRLMRVSGRTAASSLPTALKTRNVEKVAQAEIGVSAGNVAATFTLPHGGIVASTFKVSANGVELPTSAYTLTPGVGSDVNVTPNPEVKATLALKAGVTDMEASLSVSYQYGYSEATSVPAGHVEFSVNDEKEFEVTTTVDPADEGKMVRAFYTIPNDATVEYFEINDGKWYPLGDSYGPQIGFPLTDGTDALFRATFTGNGVRTLTIEYREVGTNAVVQTDVINAFVAGDSIGEVLEVNVDAAGTAMIAQGGDVSYNLAFVPKAGLKLYADGAEVTADARVFEVQASQKKLVLHSTDQIVRGQRLEVAYAYDETETYTPSIELESVYGGSLYNQMKVKSEVNSGIVTITITKPDAKKALMSEAPMVFKSTDYPSFQLMVNAINSHADNTQVVRATTKYPDNLTSDILAKPDTTFTGGNDEISLSREEMYKRLGGVKDSEGYIVKQGAYQILENYTVDYVVPLGVYADDQLVGKYDNFAYQLALACAVMSHFNSVTIGLIATSTPTDVTLTAVEEHVQKLIAIDNSFYMRDRFGNEIKDGEGERIDLGQFITIVAGPDIIVNNTRLGLVATNSPASALGYISTLAPQSAPTNKSLATALGLRYEYSAAQQDKLTAARYMVYKYKNNRSQVAIVDAMTAAHAGSDYTRLSTARIVKEAVNIIRQVADPYIGEPNDAANRNALTSAISKELDKMKEDKALLGYDFQIVATPQMELVGEASIELSLQAPRELRRLTTIVSLTV